MARRAPLLYHAVSIGFLLLGLWGIRALRSVTGLPRESPADRFRYPLTIDGAPAASPEETRLLVERGNPGEVIFIRNSAGVHRITLRRAFKSPYLLISLVRVRADASPDGGAAFTCEVPEWTSGTA